MKIRDKGTALEIWEALQRDFQNKSRMVAVDLRRCLQQEQCIEKRDVRAHFAKLRTMREDLAAMGHPPDDDEFYAIILGSLPSSFEPFISALNATSSVLGTILSPDELMQAFTDEYERRNIGKSSKREEENAAFSTKEGNGRKGNNRKGKCYNCRKPGHCKDDCWEEGGGKADQKPNWLKEKEKWRKEREGSKEREKSKAAATATSAITEDAAWMAHFSDSDLDDDDNIMSSTNVTLNDLLEVDKELRNEMSRGKEPRKEYYPIQNAGNTACTYTLHKTNGSEESRGLWNELVEGESVEIDEQVNNEGNQPIPQPAKFEPEPEDVDWPITVRGTPYASDANSSSASASDSRLPSASAPATSSLFRNAFGRMTSYATRSRSHGVA